MRLSADNRECLRLSAAAEAADVVQFVEWLALCGGKAERYQGGWCLRVGRRRGPAADTIARAVREARIAMGERVEVQHA